MGTEEKKDMSGETLFTFVHIAHVVKRQVTYAHTHNNTTVHVHTYVHVHVYAGIGNKGVSLLINTLLGDKHG